MGASDLVLLAVAVVLIGGCAIIAVAGGRPRFSPGARAAVLVLLGVGAVAALVLGSAIPVFCAALAANLTVGRLELYPLSAYTMFADTRDHIRRIAIETPDGSPVSGAAAFGVNEVELFKRFNTEVAVDGDLVRTSVVLARLLDDARAAAGLPEPLAASQLVLCEYRLVEGRPVESRSPLGEPFGAAAG